ncbi:MAG: aspartyl protease family protein [Acidiferrobacterales bacterium]
MPSLNLQISPLGPILQAFIAVSPPRQTVLQKAGQPVPPPQLGTFLVDTGASGTCVDPSLLVALGITPKGITSVQTPSTNGAAALCPVYDVQLIVIPAMQSPPKTPISFMPHVRSISVIGAQLVHQGIHGLIGRDVLEQWLLIYNGQVGVFTLSW